MGIEDINISETLETNAPSIKYTGNEGPKSPQEEQQMMMQQQMQMAGGENDRVRELLQKEETMGLDEMEKEELRALIKTISAGMQQEGIESLGAMDQDPRQMAAYGGIMGMDGRKKYGIGSWFQENIMDPIKESSLGKAATVAAGTYLGNKYLPKKYGGGKLNDFFETIGDSVGTGKDKIVELLGKQTNTNDPKSKTYGQTILSSIGKNVVPILGGLTAGLFTKNQEGENVNPGTPNDQTGIDLAEYKKSVNLLDQKQSMAGNFNFAPTVDSRLFSPEEMAVTYSQNAANGGRIGYNMGGGADMGAPQMNNAQVTEEAITKIIQKMQDPNLTDQDRAFLQAQLQNFAPQPQMPMMGMEGIESVGMAMGGRIGRAEGGLMDLGGMEKDYRAEGGFVPIGAKEKADDVPARLSVNEFVFTADAVRSAGGGDIDQGAQVMENMMKHLEQGGQVSEESQGMSGAQEMFETSERLSEVV